MRWGCRVQPPFFYVLLTSGGDQDNGLTRPPDRFSRDGRAARERRQSSRACKPFVSACAVLVTAIIVCVVLPLMLAAEPLPSMPNTQLPNRLGHRRERTESVVSPRCQ